MVTVLLSSWWQTDELITTPIAHCSSATFAFQRSNSGTIHRCRKPRINILRFCLFPGFFVLSRIKPFIAAFNLYLNRAPIWCRGTCFSTKAPKTRAHQKEPQSSIDGSTDSGSRETVRVFREKWPLEVRMERDKMGCSTLLWSRFPPFHEGWLVLYRHSVRWKVTNSGGCPEVFWPRT